MQEVQRYSDTMDSWPMERLSAASQVSSEAYENTDGSSEPPSWLAAGMTAQMLAARVFDGTQDVDAAASEDVEPSLRVCEASDGEENIILKRQKKKLPLIEYTGFECLESLRFDDGCNSMTTMEVPDSMDLALACVYPDRVNPAHANFPDTLQRNWAFRGCAVQKPINPFFLYNKSNKPLLSSAEPGDALYQFETAIYGHSDRHPWSLSDAYEHNHRDCFPVASRYPVSFKTWRSNILRELSIMRASQDSKKVRTKYVPLCVDTLWQCVRFGFVGVDPVGAIQWVSYPAGEQNNASWFLEAYPERLPFQTVRKNSLNGRPIKETMAMGVHSEAWMARLAIEKRSRVCHKWNGPPPRYAKSPHPELKNS
ncbi:hypothetical protein HDU80_011309 [Chytriomyces hyalinus]|nr:hypothetical protein HDU80_011309 [Chytriomyces hyalinus]